MRSAIALAGTLAALTFAGEALAQGRSEAHNPQIDRALESRQHFAQSHGLALGQNASGGGFTSPATTASGGHASPQSGTGRIGFESVWDRRDRHLRQGSQGLTTSGNLGAGDRARDVWGRNRRSDASGSDSTTQTQANNIAARRDEIVSHGANQRAATLADRWLSTRMANIDHLRDVALSNGNTQLLQKADQLADHVHEQYLWRTGQIDHPFAPLPPDATSSVAGTTPPFNTPDTTSPDTTSPGTTSPGTTSPGTTSPGTTSPGTTPRTTTTLANTQLTNTQLTNSGTIPPSSVPPSGIPPTGFPPTGFPTLPPTAIPTTFPPTALPTPQNIQQAPSVPPQGVPGTFPSTASFGTRRFPPLR